MRKYCIFHEIKLTCKVLCCSYFCFKEKKMSILSRIFSRKSSEEPTNEVPEKVYDNVAQRAQYIEEVVIPKMCGDDYLHMYESIPEVFFPIDYIASRIAGANFVIKRTSDDSIVWRRKELNKIISRPNCIMSFREFVYQHFVYKLALGNSFIRAAMADNFRDSSKYKFCSNFWVLPSNNVSINKKSNKVPLFGICDADDIIGKYTLSASNGKIDIPAWQVWHDRDGGVDWNSYKILRSKSRLASLTAPISNLLAVYEARNVIYVKRGGLGFIVNQQQDVTGSVALKDSEVRELLTQHYEKYGIKKGQYPYGFSNTPISFVRTNLSISELQPFDETLADAISIAGAFGIPAVLVPRKDQSTFSNQSAAEKSVYCSQVIPLAKRFCEEFSVFLGLEDLYIDCDFSYVDCLQSGMKEAEDVKTSVNNRCQAQFEHGLITLNDWRAQIGESKVEDEIFDKLKFHMSDEELELINRVINNKSREDYERNQVPSVSY